MSFFTKRVFEYAGWRIHEFRRPTVDRPAMGQTLECVDHFSAMRHGVGMNTNSLEGIKSMVDTRNWLDARAPAWGG